MIVEELPDAETKALTPVLQQIVRLVALDEHDNERPVDQQIGLIGALVTLWCKATDDEAKALRFFIQGFRERLAHMTGGKT